MMVPNKKSIVILLFGSAISIFVLLVRMLNSGTNTYHFMVLNIFLAWLPLVFSSLLIHHKKFHRHHTSLLIPGSIFLLWFLFFPNAPYMVTDLIHLKYRDGIPLWFDAIMLQQFALVGLFIEILSLAQVRSVLIFHYGKQNTRYFSLSMLFLTSLGVSLGRFLRWNSWDVFFSPIQIVNQLFTVRNSSAVYIEIFSFTLIFFAFLFFVHLFVEHVWDKQ